MTHDEMLQMRRQRALFAGKGQIKLCRLRSLLKNNAAATTAESAKGKNLTFSDAVLKFENEADQKRLMFSRNMNVKFSTGKLPDTTKSRQGSDKALQTPSQQSVKNRGTAKTKI